MGYESGGTENLEVDLPQFRIEGIDRLVDFALDLREIFSMGVHKFSGHLERFLVRFLAPNLGNRSK